MWYPHCVGRLLHPWGCGKLFWLGFGPWLGMQWGEVQGIQLGVIGAAPWSLRDPKWGQKSKPSKGTGDVSGWDLALGMDHDTHTCQNEEAAWWPCGMLSLTFGWGGSDCPFCAIWYWIFWWLPIPNYHSMWFSCPTLCWRANTTWSPHKMILCENFFMDVLEDWIGHFFISPPLPQRQLVVWRQCGDDSLSAMHQPIPCEMHVSVSVWLKFYTKYESCALRTISHSVGYTVVLWPW